MSNEEINKFVDCCIERGFEISVNLKNIRMIMLNELGKKQILYPFGKYQVKLFIDALEYAGLGKYDEVKQIFIFNQDNPVYIKIIAESINAPKTNSY